MTRVPEQSYHHGNLRAVLVQAALELLKTQAPEELSLRGLAASAGVSRAAPYAHFADKAALLRAVASAGFALMAEDMRKSMDGATDARGRFLATGRAYVRFARGNPNVFRLMFGGGHERAEAHPPHGTEGGPSEVFEAALRAYLEESRVTVADEQLLRTTAWSCVHGLSLLLLDHRLGSSADDGEQLVVLVTSLFADLLRPSAQA